MKHPARYLLAIGLLSGGISTAFSASPDKGKETGKEQPVAKAATTPKKTATAEPAANKARAAMSDALRDALLEQAQPKTTSQTSQIDNDRINSQMREKMKGQNRGKEPLTTAYQPSVLTPMPKLNCGPHAALVKVEDEWRCEIKENRRPQGSNVWVASLNHWDGAVEITFVNPGNVSNTVRCLAFDNNGRLVTDLGSSQIVPAGGTGRCLVSHVSFSRELGKDVQEYVIQWYLLAADRPILPHTYAVTGAYVRTLDMYPIDCADAEGFEVACRFAPSVGTD